MRSLPVKGMGPAEIRQRSALWAFCQVEEAGKSLLKAATPVPEEERASEGLHCCECEEKWPQSILTSQWMPIVHEVLGEGRAYVPSL